MVDGFDKWKVRLKFGVYWKYEFKWMMSGDILLWFEW